MKTRSKIKTSDPGATIFQKTKKVLDFASNILALSKRKERVTETFGRLISKKQNWMHNIDAVLSQWPINNQFVCEISRRKRDWGWVEIACFDLNRSLSKGFWKAWSLTHGPWEWQSITHFGKLSEFTSWPGRLVYMSTSDCSKFKEI